MSQKRLLSSLRLAVATCTFLFACLPASFAQTECDTDPDRVFFQPTVDPTRLNDFLLDRGTIGAGTGSGNLTVNGLCVKHNIGVSTGRLDVPVSTAPFTVTPSNGSIRVDLLLEGPFAVGVDGSNYTATNCRDICVIELPYIGEIINGCELEADFIGPIFGLLQASVTWDDINLTQVADTCVLGDCTAVHPLESTTANLFNLDIQTGLSCDVCSIFPDELRFLCPGSFDPCSLLDSLLSSLLVPVIEGIVEDAFVNILDQGILIQVFSNQIRTDFGCIPIPEVRDCQAQQSRTMAGLLRDTTNRGMNAVLYMLPLFLVGGLVIRHRRRR